MIICKNCGTKNEDRNVCTKCGSFLYKKNTIREKDPKILRDMRNKKVKGTAKGIFSSCGITVLVFIIGSILMLLLFSFLASRLTWPTEEELLEELEQFEAKMTTQSSIDFIPPN